MSNCWKCGRELPEGQVECEDDCQARQSQGPDSPLLSAMNLVIAVSQVGKEQYSATVWFEGHTFTVEVRKKK